ncbi:hypothetical protein FQN54_002016 [Arachnomyces sp. PD_36]|nr:hypothetical protein FQN54_002016 [Arachnomyces sp. PD_36]
MLRGSGVNATDNEQERKRVPRALTSSRWRVSHLKPMAVVALMFAGICCAKNPPPVWQPYGISQSSSGISEESDFNWSQLESKEELEFTDCHGEFECALLDVPLDWNSTESSRKISIALSRLPARVSVTDPRYGGAIIVNPGGPGASGVNFLSEFGESLRSIVDSAEDSPSADAKYFDLVAFDPRGIGYSRPVVNCFPDTASRNAWDMQSDVVILKGSNDSFAEIWSRQYAISEGCSTITEDESDGDDLVRFVNTTPVAADMIEIIERLGQWREKTAKSWLQSSNGESLTSGKPTGDDYHVDSVLSRTAWVQGQEKIQFWGFSYGTVIGATFAAMYPDRIHRFILDGVVDSEEYYKAGTMKSLVNTDEIWDRFFQYCFEAGPSRCKFHLNNSSPEEIRQQFNELLERVRSFPIPVPATDGLGPEIIRYQDIINRIFSSLYKPIEDFPVLDELLTDLVVGTGSKFASYKSGLRTVSCPSASCQDTDLDSTECDPFRPFNFDASRVTFCTDAESIHGESPDAFKEKWYQLSEQSELFSDFWILIRMTCVGWNLRPSWRFGGPFTGTTSYPILWIGNSRDPVTPVSNARKMAQGFKGSEVLEINTEGHCSFAGPSTCAAKAINQYFQKGVLPDPGTICQPDLTPFIDGDPDTDEATLEVVVHDSGHDVNELK